MKVYHGSYIKVDKIDLSESKPNKDFGRGFYVTKFRNHEETHQICFCTLNSLQTIDRIDDTPTYEIVMISEPIIEKLIVDFDFDEEKATKSFFDSDTYNQLSDVETKLYEKDWTEIYKLLLDELKLQK